MAAAPPSVQQAACAGQLAAIEDADGARPPDIVGKMQVKEPADRYRLMKIIERERDGTQQILKSITVETPGQARALGDVLCALGLPEEEVDDDDRCRHLLSKMAMENVAVLINYAISIQHLDRPALRTKLLDYWPAPSAFAAIQKMNALSDDAFRRMNVFLFARYRFGDDIGGGPYAGIMQQAMTEE